MDINNRAVPRKTLKFDDVSIHFANFRHDHNVIDKDLLDNILSYGQQETIKVVEKDGKFFVIDGWKRCVALNSLNLEIKYEVIENNIAAISEYFVFPNFSVRSDFETFKTLKAIVECANLSRLEVSKVFGITKTKVDNFFCFDNIFDDVLEAIGDLRLVTASTAKAICTHQNKGHRKALIDVAKHICEGAGSTKLSEYVDDFYKNTPKKEAAETKKKTETEPLEIKNKSGDILAQWSGAASITLRKDISLDDEDLIGEILTQAIRSFYSVINKKTLEKKHDEKYGNKYGGAEIVSIPRQVA